MTGERLYPFQEEAVKKLLEVRHCLNADDMGLGKTVQAIALDLERRKQAYDDLKAQGACGKAVATVKAYGLKRPFMTLIIAPLSVIPSWVDHYARWSNLKVISIDPKNRWPFEIAVKRKSHDVYICHWESLRLMSSLKTVEWFHIIADEVHRAKNRKAQQTIALKKLKAQHRTGLSGTPADNKPHDLWSILNWLYPKQWSSYWRFFNHHVLFRERYTASGNLYKEICGVAHADEIHRAMKPFYVRRLKTEVLQDLPDKYYTTLWVNLTPQQRKAYDSMRKDMLAWVGEHESEPIAAPVVVAQLMRLQQFACAYGKIEAATRRKRDCPDKSCRLAGRCQGHMIKQLRLDDPSSKLDLVMDLINDNPEEQFVVFSQSKQLINLFAGRLERHKSGPVPHGLITGDTSKTDRGDLVQAFQDGKLRILAGTIAAGGEGITLTAASTVVFMDRAWSPSRNRQAEDRLHRIGQKNAVQVIDIVARNTVDLGRLQRLEQKWSWIREILGDKVEEQQRLFEDTEAAV